MSPRPYPDEDALARARSLFYQGRCADAAKAYGDLAWLYPPARVSQAACLFAGGDYAGASKAYAALWGGLSPSARRHSGLWWWLARSQADQGQWSDSLGTLVEREKIQALPAAAEALKAEDLQALGRPAGPAWDSAAGAAMRQDPHAAMVSYQTAAFYESQGDTAAARHWFTRTRRLDLSYSVLPSVAQALQAPKPDTTVGAPRLGSGQAQLVPAPLTEEEIGPSDSRLARPTRRIQPLAGQVASPSVRIGLMTHLSSLVFKTGGAMKVYGWDPSAGKRTGQVRLVLPADRVYRLEYKKGKWNLKRKVTGKTLLTFRKAILLQPKDPRSTFRLFDVVYDAGTFFGGKEDRGYRGSLALLPRSAGQLNAVNVLPLEAYLLGVVPSEIESGWPEEALKAQAIVARTDVLGKLGLHASEGFDLCADVHCCAYDGVGRETPRTTQAVLKTRGRVLVRQDNCRLIPALYMDSCGGHTQSYQEAWVKPDPSTTLGAGSTPSGKNTSLGSGVGDMEAPEWTFPMEPQTLLEFVSNTCAAYCALPSQQASDFRWVKVYPRQDLEKFVAKVKDLGELLEVQPVVRSDSGFVRSLKLKGTKGEVVLTGDHIRFTVKGLKSNFFYVESRPGAKNDGKPAEFVFTGGGWGHGVGFCQTGAAGRAQRGQMTGEILEAYFPNAEIYKRY
jgi:peptidoglycan hydrolase-like amidase